MRAQRSFFSWLCEDQLRKLADPYYVPPSYVSRFSPRTILCPVSLRPESDNAAVCIAFQLAQQEGAELLLLHSQDAELDSKSARMNRERLRDLQASLSDVETKSITTWGDPASAIIRATADSDLLVMRPSQPSWLVGRLVDSLSQRVCRLAHCPVMLLHGKIRKRIAPAIRTRRVSRDVKLQGAYRGRLLTRD
jgi:nucleotide-binding universal stress UspA family protein